MGCTGLRDDWICTNASIVMARDKASKAAIVLLALRPSSLLDPATCAHIPFHTTLLMVHYRRDDSHGGLSRQNIIIIAACGGVGGVILLGLLIHCIRRRMRAGKALPLPPPQPLAHQRERELSKFYSSSRPGTMYSDAASLRVPPSRQLPHRASDASLLPSSPSTISRHTSSMTGHDTAEDISLAGSPLALSDSYLNLPPNPDFRSQSDENGSSSSLSSEAWQERASSSQTADLYAQRKARRSSMGSRRQRTPSLTSASTSMSSASRLRSGLPHAPYSNVQIVLPTPLSLGNRPPTMQMQEQRPRSYADGASRLSIVDQWVPGTARTEAPRPSEPRASPLSQPAQRSQAVPHTPRRNYSGPPSTPSHGPWSTEPPVGLPVHMPPPVPRIPSMYSKAPVEYPPADSRGESV
ncbi:hypothetical protein CYLTODRAFT_492257 [Cylindrobasidium torrendii FP15055 ss-10]|uniref:Uncharacterized protein n=1 Tax=Cylindrobasidium torrendii FP15055 ss-10 TaxID=1314674 RepID=A0A0D7B5P0_9AGAR|nr:hypothetical protein CYLTODRAFT_492257 [Cylindrobasidium torrendii FP15055 ss-10]